MTRWLVTGGAGQLATHLGRALGADAIVARRADLDITSAQSVDAAVAAARPDVIINAAAYTAVDAAETDEAAAYAVNATGVENLARAAGAAGARLLHVSTDYVFDGADPGHAYGVDDDPAPRTAYGRTKLAGERLAVAHGATVVRTAWVYGGPAANFVDTMLRLAESRDQLDVVSDQIGSPTYVADLADALIALGQRGGPVVPMLHFANLGTASWFDLAQETFRAVGLDPARIRPVDSTQFVRAAPRPAWSVLSLESWDACGLPGLRGWREALRDCLARRDAAATEHARHRTATS